MSYYRPSFKQTAAMSRGGRGYSSRGSSYRGNRGSSWDRGGRGSFSSNRGGRFSSSWNSGNSFDSRPRYSSSSGERYSASHGRNEEPNYRRSSYRSEGPNNSYSSRETSTRSPERKRMRPEAPSSRRSHEGGYSGGDGGYGGSSGSRYESSQGYGERRSFEERRPSFRSPREEFRKPGPPPTRSPRGGYRGRISTRGTRGSRISLVRRRVLDTRSYVRRRGAPLRSTADYLRAMRMSKLRSGAVIRRIIKRTKDAEKDDSDKEEENWDDEGNETEKKKDDGSEKGDEDETEETDEKKISPKKSPKKEKEMKEKDAASDKEEKKESSDEDDRPRSKYTGRPFIRLTCIHCKMKCVTFKEYSIHLYSGIHISAMRKIALRQKAVLGRMRASQRLHQRELEKNEENLGTRTIFCPLCKLNYRQKKEVHQMSDAHKSMKKFLMPYCRTCYITFKSPMLYENHVCSLDHIRRKASSEAVNGEKHASDKEADSPAEEDLENFMTLDSVGDVDEDEDGNKIAKTPATDGESVKPKEAINVGVEHCKKVEVYYCELCRVYLNRNAEDEQILNSHCGGRMHLQRYVRYKKDKELLRQAEKIHRKSQEAKEAKQKEVKIENDKAKTDKTAADGEKILEEDNIKQEQIEEEAGDDKMWEDVDKDLGEILAEVNTETGNKSSDEDEDSRPNGERYDRFKLHKGIDEKGDSKSKKTNAEDKVNEDKIPAEEEEEEKMEEDAEQREDK